MLYPDLYIAYISGATRTEGAGLFPASRSPTTSLCREMYRRRGSCIIHIHQQPSPLTPIAHNLISWENLGKSPENIKKLQWSPSLPSRQRHILGILIISLCDDAASGDDELLYVYYCTVTAAGDSRRIIFLSTIIPVYKATGM